MSVYEFREGKKGSKDLRYFFSCGKFQRNLKIIKNDHLIAMSSGKMVDVHKSLCIVSNRNKVDGIES